MSIESWEHIDTEDKALEWVNEQHVNLYSANDIFKIVDYFFEFLQKYHTSSTIVIKTLQIIQSILSSQSTMVVYQSHTERFLTLFQILKLWSHHNEVMFELMKTIRMFSEVKLLLQFIVSSNTTKDSSPISTLSKAIKNVLSISFENIHELNSTLEHTIKCLENFNQNLDFNKELKQKTVECLRELSDTFIPMIAQKLQLVDQSNHHLILNYFQLLLLSTNWDFHFNPKNHSNRNSYQMLCKIILPMLKPSVDKNERSEVIHNGLIILLHIIAVDHNENTQHYYQTILQLKQPLRLLIELIPYLSTQHGLDDLLTLLVTIQKTLEIKYQLNQRQLLQEVHDEEYPTEHLMTKLSQNVDLFLIEFKKLKESHEKKMEEDELKLNEVKALTEHIVKEFQMMKDSIKQDVVMTSPVVDDGLSGQLSKGLNSIDEKKEEVLMDDKGLLIQIESLTEERDELQAEIILTRDALTEKTLQHKELLRTLKETKKTLQEKENKLHEVEEKVNNLTKDLTELRKVDEVQKDSSMVSVNKTTDESMEEIKRMEGDEVIKELMIVNQIAREQTRNAIQKAIKMEQMFMSSTQKIEELLIENKYLWEQFEKLSSLEPSQPSRGGHSKAIVSKTKLGVKQRQHSMKQSFNSELDHADSLYGENLMSVDVLRGDDEESIQHDNEGMVMKESTPSHHGTPRKNLMLGSINKTLESKIMRQHHKSAVEGIKNALDHIEIHRQSLQGASTKARISHPVVRKANKAMRSSPLSTGSQSRPSPQFNRSHQELFNTSPIPSTSIGQSFDARESSEVVEDSMLVDNLKLLSTTQSNLSEMMDNSVVHGIESIDHGINELANLIVQLFHVLITSNIDNHFVNKAVQNAASQGPFSDRLDSISMATMKRCIYDLGFIDADTFSKLDFEVFLKQLRVYKFSVFGIGYCILMCGSTRYPELHAHELIQDVMKYVENYIQSLEYRVYGSLLEESGEIRGPSTGRKDHRRTEWDGGNDNTTITSRSSTGYNTSNRRRAMSDVTESVKETVFTHVEPRRLDFPTSYEYPTVQDYLDKERKALTLIHQSYVNFTTSKGMSLTNALLFAKEFDLCPQLFSRVEISHLFHQTVQMSHKESTRKSTPERVNSMRSVSPNPLRNRGILNYQQFKDFLIALALHCPLFKGTQQDSMLVKVSNLLLLLNNSNGPKRILSRRRDGSLIIFRVNPIYFMESTGKEFYDPDMATSQMHQSSGMQEGMNEGVGGPYEAVNHMTDSFYERHFHASSPHRGSSGNSLFEWSHHSVHSTNNLSNKSIPYFNATTQSIEQLTKKLPWNDLRMLISGEDLKRNR